MDSRITEARRWQRPASVLVVVAALMALLIVVVMRAFVPDDGTTAPAVEVPGRTAVEPSAPVTRVEEADAAQPGKTPRRSAAFTKALSGFKGRVVQRNQGVPDAAVTITRFDVDALWTEGVTLMGGETHAPSFAIGRAVTDSNGDFLVTGVWPKSFYLLRATHGSRQASTRAVNTAPGPGEIVDLGDIEIKDAATIVGTVVDPNSRPVAGATVRAAIIPERLMRVWPVERLDFETPLIWINGDSKHVFDLPNWVRDRFEDLLAATTVTDANGKFVLEGVPLGRVQVLIHRAALVPALERVDATGTTDLGTLRLGHGTTARGFVRDQRGGPVANAEVLIGPASAGLPLVFAAPAGKTDSSGMFEASGFARGYVVAAARAAPGLPWVVGKLQAIEREITLIVPDAHSLTLDVRSKSGQPIPEPRFKVLPSATRLPTIDLALLGLVRPLPLEGRVSRLEDGRHVIRGLPGGWYAVQADAPGYAVGVKTISLESDSELELLLDGLKPFEVLVKDARGKPIADAQVFVHAAGDFPRVPLLPLNCGCTGEDGRLRVTEAASNRVAVRATHPGFAPTELVVDLPIEVVEMTLPAPGTIEGVLTESGKSPTPGRWSLSVRRTQPRPHAMVMPRLYSPDDEGCFRVTGLQPGHYEVSIIEAVGPVGMEFAMDTRVYAKQLRARRRSKSAIPVRSGRTTRLELDTQGDATNVGPTVPVAGTLTVNGKPGVGLEVTGYHRRWLSAKVGDDGSFDLGRVAIGDADLYVVDPARTRKGAWEVLWWKRVPLAEDRDIRLNIELQLGELSGVVLQADGMPVRGSMVRMDGKTGGRADKAVHCTLWAATDREGRFRFDRLQAGVYQAQVWEHKYGRAKVAGIRVGQGQAPHVRLRLGRVVSVDGRVDMSAFGPQTPQWAWMALYRLDPAGAAVSKEWGAEVRSDGSFLVSSIPPGRYEVQISGMFREATVEPEWETRTYRNARPLQISDAGLTGIRLRPGKQIQARRENHKEQKHERKETARKRVEKLKRLRRARENKKRDEAESKKK